MTIEAKTISPELAANLLKMAEIEQSKNIPSGEKDQKLSALRQVTLSQIAAEINKVGVASQKILENIGRIVEDEEWTKLPTPEQLELSLSEAKKIAETLESIAGNSLPDLFELQRLLLESKIKQYAALTDQEILSMNQMVKSAQDEFLAQEKSATTERNAGLISGGLSAGLALTTAVAKGVVSAGAAAKLKSLRGEDFKADQAKLKKLNSEIKPSEEKLDKVNKGISEINTKIANKEIELSALKSNLKNETKSGTGDVTRIANLTSERDDAVRHLIELKAKRNALSVERDSVKSEIEALKVEHGQIRQKMNGPDNEAAEFTQKWRTSLDIYDSISHMLQSGLVKTTEASLEFDAKQLKIEADKRALDKNFATTVQQNAQKDKQDVEDGAKSLLSSIGAMQQTLMSTDSHIIRTI